MIRFPPPVCPSPLVSLSRRVSNAALVLSSKTWKNVQDGGGSVEKEKSKKPWAFCRRAGKDAAFVRVQFDLRGCTHHRK